MILAQWNDEKAIEVWIKRNIKKNITLAKFWETTDKYAKNLFSGVGGAPRVAHDLQRHVDRAS